MSRVAVKENVLRWAIDRSNKSVDALRSHFPKIREWIDGVSQPTLKQLEALSRETTTPFGLPLLDAPPDEQLPIPHFRTMDDRTVHRPSVDLIDTIQTMQRRQDWMRDYVADTGQAPLSFVDSVKLGEPAQSVAERMRATLGFNEDWASRFATWEGALRALREAMERVGILVFANGVVGNNTHRVLNPDEFRGFVLVDGYAPLVFVNAADPRVAQMFTLAHELAHVFYGSSAAFDLRQMMAARDKTEQACNRVAAEFLVPEKQMREAWAPVRGDQQSRFDQLTMRFKVSTIVVARRALDLDLIDRKAFLKFYLARIAEHQSIPSAKGGNFYASQSLRVGMRFGAAVVRSVREGRTLYTEAYSLTGLRGSTFDNYAAGIET